MSEGSIMTPQDHVRRIAALLERRRFDLAGHALGEALATFPDDSDLLYQGAHLEHLQEHHASARRSLEQMLVHDPAHFQGRYLLALVCEELDDLPGSELILIDLIRDYPELGALYAKYAMLMYRTLHVDKASALAREAIRLDPDDELALTACVIGDMIAGRKVDKRNSLAELMRKHPEDIITARLLIVHLVEQGKYWSAKRIAVELLRAQPDSRDLLELVVNLESLCHWTMVPLWPMNRWGFGATLGFYAFTLLVLNLARDRAPEIFGPLNYGILGYVIYSWVYPPLLKRWLHRRAGI